MYDSFLNFELSILNSISNFKCDFLDGLMVFITSLANKGFMWIALSIILLSFKKTRRIGICVSLGLVFNFLLVNVLIKPIIARPRPYDVNTAIKLIIPPPVDYSFPSGHTSASFAASCAVCIHNKKWGIPLLLLASLIAFSRLYLCVHFPSDVIFGIAFGIICSYASNYICKKHFKI